MYIILVLFAVFVMRFESQFNVVLEALKRRSIDE